jgi:predicted transglutaminase-like cysteine proteinase
MVTDGHAKELVQGSPNTPVAAPSSLVGSISRSASAFGATKLCVTICLSLGTFAQGQANAASSGLPNALQTTVEHIQLDIPTLAPMADTMFCIRYPSDCEVGLIAFRGGEVPLTAEKWNELVTVNKRVNRDIIPQPYLGVLATEQWLVSPPAGDCNDYVVTKRHELVALGWPPAALLLAEVVTDWGEHHLILVIRTQKEDFVLDNLTANIRPWSETPYQWVRIQSPSNPKFWSTVRSLSS